MTEHTFGWQALARSFLTVRLAPQKLPPGSWASAGNDLYLHRPSSWGFHRPEPGSIFVVDDVPRLTELYSSLLEASGYVVTSFNDRLAALKALSSATRSPSLLITDYIGLSMPIDKFMVACRGLYPELPILMASGFYELDMRPLRVKPNRFIQKPFTPEELRRAVKAALAGE